MSVGKNFAFNLIVKLSNIVFPIITFPYILRIIGAEGIGKVNFANSFISYFILISNLGIPLYGIREIARIRNDKEKLNSTYIELFIINIILAMISFIVYFFCIITIESLRKEFILFLLMGISIVLNIFSIDWFYCGIENYKYISIRNIVMKIISLILIFLLVKNKSDYLIYGTLGVVALTGNNIFNILHSRKFIKYRITKEINLKRHFKPILLFFSMMVSVTLYININPVVLGFFHKIKDVGFFTTYSKLITIATGIVSSFTGVLLPRLSLLIECKKENEYSDLVKKSIEFAFFIIMPIIGGFIAFGSVIVNIFAGKEFVDNLNSFYIMIPIIYFSSISMLYGSMILFPNKKEKITMIPPIFGAVVNIICVCVSIYLNVLSVVSVAISYMLAEMVVSIVQFYYSKKVYSKIFLVNKTIIRYVVLVFMEVVILYFIYPNYKNGILYFITFGSIYCITYVLVLLLLKDNNMKRVFNKFHKKIR